MGLFKPNAEKQLAKRDVEGLVKALKYKSDEYVRNHAAWFLGELNDARAVEPLIQVLRDEYIHRYLRKEAEWALRILKDAGR